MKGENRVWKKRKKQRRSQRTDIVPSRTFPLRGHGEYLGELTLYEADGDTDTVTGHFRYTFYIEPQSFAHCNGRQRHGKNTLELKEVRLAFRLSPYASERRDAGTIRVEVWSLGTEDSDVRGKGSASTNN